MEYGLWKYRNGRLRIEKYIGDIDYETIVKTDLNLFDGLDESYSELKILTDVNKASFTHLKISEIKKMVDFAAKSTEFISNVKAAFYTGSNNYEDFQKVMNYSKYASEKSFTSIPFNLLDTALEWLELSKDEIIKIKSDLAGMKPLLI